MKKPQSNYVSLFTELSRLSDLSHHFVFAGDETVSWSQLLSGSVLDSRGDELQGRSVLIATKSQLTALWALMELDGLASRIVLYPPDMPLEHLSYVIEAAEADVLVSDRMRVGEFVPSVKYFTPCSRAIVPLSYERGVPIQTKWILLTSGTTGPPKLVEHTLASLSGAIAGGSAATDPVIWSTFYDIRRYGGLQILLRAALSGVSLLLPGAQESTADFLARAGLHGITHISGTPSHWRQVLMSSSAHLIAPKYVRLSGEIADQGILNHLRSAYPQARIAHAFASTEAGVAFEVNDGLAGFSASVLGETPGVEMKVERGSLRIRSSRTASRYLGKQCPDASGRRGLRRYIRLVGVAEWTLPLRRSARWNHQRRRVQGASGGSGIGDQSPSGRADVARAGKEKSDHRLARRSRRGLERNSQRRQP